MLKRKNKGGFFVNHAQRIQQDEIYRIWYTNRVKSLESLDQPKLIKWLKKNGFKKGSCKWSEYDRAKKILFVTDNNPLIWCNNYSEIINWVHDWIF